MQTWHSAYLLSCPSLSHLPSLSLLLLLPTQMPRLMAMVRRQTLEPTVYHRRKLLQSRRWRQLQR